jgi:NAD(P)H dehydrogenase (quinone)
VLRNGWYLENFDVASALTAGVAGAAGEGRISAATRADLAAAAAVVIAGEGHEGRVHELGGESFTLAEFAAEVSRQSGQEVGYTDLGEREYRDLLLDVGAPEPMATAIADAHRGAAKGMLEVEGDDLPRLLGRPATTLADYVRAALA